MSVGLDNLVGGFDGRGPYLLLKAPDHDLDEVVPDNATLVRGPESVPDRDAGPLVIEDLYRFVYQYRDADADRRGSARERMEQVVADGRPVVCVTSPYRLRWVIENARLDLEEAFGEVETYRIRTWEIDCQEAEERLEQYHDDGRLTETEFEDARENVESLAWEYDLGGTFRPLLGDDTFESLFGDRTEYHTYLPSIVLKARGRGIERAVGERQRFREFVKEFARDLVEQDASETATREMREGGQTLIERITFQMKLVAPQSPVGSIKCTKPLFLHQLCDVVGVLKRGEKGELTSVRFRNLARSKLLSEFITELGFLFCHLVSYVDFEPGVSFVTDIISPDEVRIYVRIRVAL